MQVAGLALVDFGDAIARSFPEPSIYRKAQGAQQVDTTSCVVFLFFWGGGGGGAGGWGPTL